MMRRSWREGQDEIRKDLKWEREQEKERGGRIWEGSVTFNILHREVGGIIQALIPVYI